MWLLFYCFALMFYAWWFFNKENVTWKKKRKAIYDGNDCRFGKIKIYQRCFLLFSQMVYQAFSFCCCHIILLRSCEQCSTAILKNVFFFPKKYVSGVISRVYYSSISMEIWYWLLLPLWYYRVFESPLRMAFIIYGLL